jgi:hypothetical protein
VSAIVLASVRRCEWCDTELVRKRYGARGSLEGFADFAARKFCGDACARRAQHAAAQSKGPCTAPGCTEPAKTLGFCPAHYHRFNRYGSATAGAPSRNLNAVARFWERVDKAGPIPDYRPDLGECWISSHRPNNKGYPMFAVFGTKVPAYRYSYEIEVGPIPDGLELDHLCRVPTCVRPVHLEPVTHAENQRRMGEALTHCRRAGHPYTPENTYRSPRGERRCRECGRDRDRQRSLRAKAAEA